MTPTPLQITCKEFVELVTAHLDGALSDRDQTRFECHSERCPGCRAYLQQFRLTVQSLPNPGGQAVGPENLVEPKNLDELLRAYRGV